jgi:helicase associated protein
VHGNCKVPRGYPDNPPLGAWVIKQRAAMNNGKLPASRRAVLEQIGVFPKPIDAAWDKMFSSLLDYKSRHGDCNVPQRWSENQSLANWVNNQRQFKRKGTLSNVRVKKLEEVGFVWNSISGFWDRMFAALLEYKRVHGHCNVPTKWSENRQLASWVVNQRSRRALLGEDRMRSLDEIGFQWKPQRGRNHRHEVDTG